MGDIERYHLSGYRMSGRAVRLEVMLPSQVDAMTKAAALTASAQQLDFHLARLRIGVARCLRGITRGPVPMVNLPVLENGKPKMRPVLDGDKRPKMGEDGKPLLEPVLEPQPDQKWLADERNWLVPDPILIELEGGYDKVIGPHPKDDSWLCTWWTETHEVNPVTVERIMSKGTRVSSG